MKSKKDEIVTEVLRLLDFMDNFDNRVIVICHYEQGMTAKQLSNRVKVVVGR